jgi:tetratricopeptide (TPR) repeat protein
MARLGYEGQLELFGADSTITLGAQRVYALCLSDAGEPGRAFELLNAALVFASDDSERAAFLRLLASALHELGRFDEAEAHYLEAIELLSPNRAGTTDLVETRHNLAVLYQQSDRLEEALELALDVLAEREATLAPDHPDLRGTWRNLAAIYRKQGRSEDEAEMRAKLGE